MAKHLLKFNTAAEYSAATINKPAVSWVVEDNEIKYDPYVPPYVEIGGVKWAKMNIGAETETDAGLYFQWGDISGYTASQVGSGEGKKYFGWTDYKYSNNGGSTAADMTKYNSTDNLTTLEASDDAAMANWGSDWRMPTKDEFIALCAAIDFIDSGGTTITATNKLTTLSGVTGILVADKNNHSKRLFFPAAGNCSNGSVSSVGGYGYSWSSSLKTNKVYKGFSLRFNSGGVNWQDDYDRHRGFPIRPVHV